MMISFCVRYSSEKRDFVPVDEEQFDLFFMMLHCLLTALTVTKLKASSRQKRNNYRQIDGEKRKERLALTKRMFLYRYGRC